MVVILIFKDTYGHRRELVPGFLLQIRSTHFFFAIKMCPYIHVAMVAYVEAALMLVILRPLSLTQRSKTWLLISGLVYASSWNARSIARCHSLCVSKIACAVTTLNAMKRLARGSTVLIICRSCRIRWATTCVWVSNSAPARGFRDTLSRFISIRLAIYTPRVSIFLPSLHCSGGPRDGRVFSNCVRHCKSKRRVS